MEISPAIAQQALEGLEGVVMFVAGLVLAAALGGRLLRSGNSARDRLREASRLVRAQVTWRALPIFGLPVGVSLAPLTSWPQSGEDASLPISSDRSFEPPWAGVSGFSPPRLLARFHGSTRSRVQVHPAIHGRRDALHPAHEGSAPNSDAHAAELFPRARGAVAHAIGRRRVRVRVDKRRAMRVHPAGSGLPTFGSRGKSEQPGRRHVVQSGETLWGIAAKALKTSDERRIARYWPRIHRANRDVIGRNPDLIFPGQVLHLPPDK